MMTLEPGGRFDMERQAGLTDGVDGSRFARRRAVSLEDATPELMEAGPGTAIRLSAPQAEQLEEIERGAGGRFRRGERKAAAPDSAAPAGRP